MFTLLPLALFVGMFLQSQSATPETRPTAPPKIAAVSAAAEDALDLTRQFGRRNGCFVLLDAKTGAARRYGAARCAERFSPCSTFKVPHALIALEAGVLDGPDHRMQWDGVKRWNEKWNHDHDLRSAMRDSVLWYFQNTARQIGPERMQAALRKLHYGNQDCSGAIDQFWLNGTLEISANEQVAFMDRLRRGDLPYAERNQAIVRDVILVERTDEYTLYGKTGTRGKEDRMVLGWFVGWVETKAGIWVFAANQSADENSNDQVNGPQTRELVTGLLRDLAIIPNGKR